MILGGTLITYLPSKTRAVLFSIFCFPPNLPSHKIWRPLNERRTRTSGSQPNHTIPSSKSHPRHQNDGMILVPLSIPAPWQHGGITSACHHKAGICAQGLGGSQTHSPRSTMKPTTMRIIPVLAYYQK